MAGSIPFGPYVSESTLAGEAVVSDFGNSGVLAQSPIEPAGAIKIAPRSYWLALQATRTGGARRTTSDGLPRLTTANN
jgi:hypothetical protein